MLVDSLLKSAKTCFLPKKTIILEILDLENKLIENLKVELFPSSEYISKSFSYNEEKNFYEITFKVDEKDFYRIVILDKNLTVLAVIENLRLDKHLKKSFKTSIRNSVIKKIKLTFEEKSVELI